MTSKVWDTAVNVELCALGKMELGILYICLWKRMLLVFDGYLPSNTMQTGQ